MSSEASMSTPIQRLPPPATLGIISICGGIYFLQSTLALDLQIFTMCPRLVLYTHEYYRIFTSTVFHVNLVHIGMNILSTSAIGTMLEKRLGTFRLMFTIWWSMLLTSSLYLILSWLAYAIFGYDKLLYSHATGFSGVIFHLSVLETYQHPGPTRSLGFVSLPPALYPWALLILTQFIMPNISFLGHLAGILTGNLQYFGWLDKFCLMSDTYLIDLEIQPLLRPLVTLPTFVPTYQCTNGQYSGSGGDGYLRMMGQSIQKVLSLILKIVRDVVETIFVCIFGRGARLNANIRLWNRPSHRDEHTDRGGIPLVTNDDNEEMSLTASQQREPLVSRIV
jgi:membrane associated rhomboid family serine protease